MEKSGKPDKLGESDKPNKSEELNKPDEMSKSFRKNDTATSQTYFHRVAWLLKCFAWA